MAIDDSILHQYGVVRGGLSQSGSRRRGPLVEGVNGPLMEGVNGTLMEGVNGITAAWSIGEIGPDRC